jgi:hypothetical protein
VRPPPQLTGQQQRATATGQVRASPPDDPEVIESGHDNVEPNPQQETKEVFEMAASLSIEEEFGTYTTRRHPHNGYYAGDFSETTRTDRSPRGSRDDRRPR